MIDTTILYLTDNAALEEELLRRFRELILQAAENIPIVSVSQKPLDFGTNICVGEIGRSGTSMEYQCIVGLEAIKTKWVAIAEHDCIYSAEHFNWTPPDIEHFWYNDNVWLCQLRHERKEMEVYNGMFSYVPKRRVQSQLIAYVPLLLQASEERYGIENDPGWKQRNHPRNRLGEPGACKYERTMSMTDHEQTKHLRQRLKQYLVGYGARDFKTKVPNIDVRHGGNLTGQRRGKCRRFVLQPWGTIEQVLWPTSPS